MPFIAVNAKSDIVGSKKGKITPAQNALINAFCLESSVGGVLDVDTSTRCEATKLSYDAVNNQATVEFHKGYFVVYGRLVEVEEGSTVVVNLPSTGEEKGNIVARFDLSASQEAEFQVLATTEPIVKENLQINSGGRYDFVLYSYTATPSGVVLDARPESFKYISRMTTILGRITSGKIEVGSAKNYSTSGGIASKFYSTDSKISSIETRLTNLGFKSGSVSLSYNTYGNATLKRQGNYVIAKFDFDGSLPSTSLSSSGMIQIGTLPFYFKPKDNVSISIGGTGAVVSNGNYYDGPISFMLTINTYGRIELSKFVYRFNLLTNPTAFYLEKFNVSLGFEAPPIT